MSKAGVYRRVLLKLSGESLGGGEGHGFSAEALRHYAGEIASAVRELHVQIAIVLGGGNIFRGLQGAERGFDRAVGDQMGMLATVINSLAVSQALGWEGVPSEVYSATVIQPMAELYRVARVREALSQGKVVILGGGTGNPYFTTDSAAALRAAELGCQALLKGTRVDGVYTADPERDPTATRYDRLTFREAYERKLAVMDMTAFTLCQENQMPVVVFNVGGKGNLLSVLRGQTGVGTVIG